MKMEVDLGDLTFEQMKQVSLQDLLIHHARIGWPESMRLNRATMLAEGQFWYDHYNRDRRGGHQSSLLSSKDGIVGFTAKERKYIKRVGVRKLRRDAKAEAQRQIREMHADERYWDQQLSWYEEDQRMSEDQDYSDYLAGVMDDPDPYDYYDDDWWPEDTSDMDDHHNWWKDNHRDRVYSHLDDRIITSADRGRTLGDLMRERHGY